MINKKNAVITTAIIGCISLSDTNACTSCALPQDLKILENILKKPKLLKGLVDKEKLKSILNDKNNYFDKIKGKILRQLPIAPNTPNTTFKAFFHVFIGKEGSKDVPKAAQSGGSSIGAQYITVTLTMNGKQKDGSSQISLESHLDDNTEYSLNNVGAVIAGSWT